MLQIAVFFPGSRTISSSGKRVTFFNGIVTMNYLRIFNRWEGLCSLETALTIQQQNIENQRIL